MLDYAPCNYFAFGMILPPIACLYAYDYQKPSHLYHRLIQHPIVPSGQLFSSSTFEVAPKLPLSLTDSEQSLLGFSLLAAAQVHIVSPDCQTLTEH